jgi:hypothetical protein
VVFRTTIGFIFVGFFVNLIFIPINNIIVGSGLLRWVILGDFKDAPKLKTIKVVYEENFYARDSGILEQLKELSSRRRAIEGSVNGRDGMDSRSSSTIPRKM